MRESYEAVGGELADVISMEQAIKDEFRATLFEMHRLRDIIHDLKVEHDALLKKSCFLGQQITERGIDKSDLLQEFYPPAQEESA